ncbi:hypothetical protein [Pseudomonas sp. B33.4]|uniref:hypothetical protein n=1 Tax=Pseudomonas sp. B33.4 TaxID=3104265 RepID=UPI002ADED7D9|nr:hypothetical protein [Pseudomonas sp. B33.4]
MSEISLKHLQELVNAAQAIMASAEHDRESAAKLTAQLQPLAETVQQSIRKIPETVKQSLNEIAEATAKKTAQSLREKFVEADKVARSVTARYQEQSRHLTKRLWSGIIATVVIVLAAQVFAVWLLVPTLDQIAERRLEVAELEQKLAALNKRAAGADLVACSHNDKPHLCFRTDESGPAGALKREGGEETYRVIWGY